MLRLVGDQQSRRAGIHPGAQQLYDGLTGDRVERTGGFVGQDQPARSDQGPLLDRQRADAISAARW
jgi:hypothetical protein